MTQKNIPLGKGLAALLGDWQNPSEPSTQEPQISMLELNQIVSGQYQPRQYFDDQAIETLAQSIAKQGLIQPITVRPKGSVYEIIAGERRWRACQKIAKSPIPVIIQHVSDETALAIALIENLQRQDLNAIEEAQALNRLIDEFNLTHQQIAEILGHSRAHITNQLRLLQLEPEVQNLLSKGLISIGHARCLIGLDTNTQIEIAEKIHQQQWSVRTTEKWLQQLTHHKEIRANNILPSTQHPMLEQLTQKWPATFEIKSKQKDKGKIIINYQSDQDLDNILQHLLKK
jgi:ParB family chromosome partitioning protein